MISIQSNQSNHNNPGLPAVRRRNPDELLAALGSYALRAHRDESAVYNHARRIERNLTRPTEELLAEQDRAISGIVNYAYEHSPFYRWKFRSVGFRFGDVKGRSDLTKLPETNKTELTANIDWVLCVPKDQLRRASTGGTSGIAFNFFRNRRCLEFRRALDLVTLRYYGWRDGQWQGWLWGAPRDLLDQTSLKAKFVQHCAERVYYVDALHLNTEAYHRFAHLTRKFRPTWISAYPSLAYDLALRIEAGEVEPFRVPMVNLTAEPAHDFQKEKIREIFADQVYERYGSRETGMAALECPAHNGLHYFTESVYFESVNRGPEAPGQALLVTDLRNYGMPLIRYETGDFAEISDAPCDCGRTSPLLYNIRGRETDTIWCPDGHGIAGTSVIFLSTQIHLPVPVQIEQDRLDHITIRIAGPVEKYQAAAAKLIEIYTREISPDITYTIEYVDHIERAPSGKYRYVISHVKPPTVNGTKPGNRAHTAQ